MTPRKPPIDEQLLAALAGLVPEQVPAAEASNGVEICGRMVA